MKKVNNIKLHLTLLFSIASPMLISCSKLKSDGNYIENTQQYLFEVHQINREQTQKNNTLFLLLDSCMPCVDSLANYLANYLAREDKDEMLKIVIEGNRKTLKSYESQISSIIKKGYKIHFDSSKHLTKYRTNIGSSILLSTSNEIHELNYSNFRKVLNNFSK